MRFLNTFFVCLALIVLGFYGCERKISSAPPPAPAVAATSTYTATMTLTQTMTTTPTNTATVTPSATPGGWDITSWVSIGGGTFSYSYIHIAAGGTLAGGSVTLNVSNYFVMDSGSTLTAGSTNGTTGTPANLTSSAGAGHGGTGGQDGLGNAGGAAYDNTMAPSYGGSPGGSGTCPIGGRPGGGMILIQAPNGSATFNGLVSANGGDSINCSGGLPGSGSGGSIYIMANDIEGSGYLQANGGSGIADTSARADNSGGGGGGIIVLSSHSVNNFSGTYSVQGGTAVSPAQPGQPGSFNQATY